MGKWKELAEPLDDRDAPTMKPTQEQNITLARAYRAGYEAGRKDENEAAIEDARTVGGEAGAEMEKLIRARREQ